MDQTCVSKDFVYGLIFAIVLIGGLVSARRTRLAVEEAMRRYGGVILKPHLSYEELRILFPEGSYRVEKVGGSDQVVLLQDTRGGPRRHFFFREGVGDTTILEIYYGTETDVSPNLCWRKLH